MSEKHLNNTRHIPSIGAWFIFWSFYPFSQAIISILLINDIIEVNPANHSFFPLMSAFTYRDLIDTDIWYFFFLKIADPIITMIASLGFYARMKWGRDLFIAVISVKAVFFAIGNALLFPAFILGLWDDLKITSGMDLPTIFFARLLPAFFFILLLAFYIWVLKVVLSRDVKEVFS